MRVIIQRVNKASVIINDSVHADIKNGLLVLAGFENDDKPEDLEWIAGKISQLRIFNDTSGVMNLSVKETDGEILLVSQFTLHASTKKGNRPSYLKAARPEIAIPLYEQFVKILTGHLGNEIKTGVFGADMKVSLINDGPVTIIIDSKERQ